MHRRPNATVIMKRATKLVLIVPGRLETATGGYIYDRRIAAGLRERGWSVDVRELDDSFPRPTAAALDDAARVLAVIPDRATVLIDGLALGAMPIQVEREASRLRIVALVHLPLAADIGIDRDTAARFERSERRALAAAALVVVTGQTTVTALSGYGVGRDRIEIVEPGTDRVPLAHGSPAPPLHNKLHLLSVATLCPGKGHDVLFRALAMVPERNWRLTCAGSLERHPPTVERLRAQLRADGLEDRVSLVGELDAAALAACYDSADVFVLATLHETYGMAVAEALAHGLPVISTATGAIPELVNLTERGVRLQPDQSAGVLVAPGDTQALAQALSHVVGDARVRERLAEGARRVRDRLPTWDDAVDKMIAALERVRLKPDTTYKTVMRERPTRE